MSKYQFAVRPAEHASVCRESAAAKDIEVRAAAARLAKIAAISEMQLQTLQLQAEGIRIGQLSVSGNGIMGNCSKCTWQPPFV